ncbi:type I DNA topoisomerase [[Mycoplasma] falconis]|uniref:DNA topoisomerase 1 n=1 Tax=[Mycoplasma] falconis TaxID=92403 RepID=A0A501X9X9_9BACT|nr:type I DNA topoisomerase [[Mycoplasma] falconis]TPE57355.1 type I DNA topoisomerase [[Mycoplasma] falconis]
MANKVMIVESPNKVNTIQKYIGDEVKVLSSVGHILKMSTKGKGGLGIDFENWEPQMVADPAKKKIISELKAAVKNADEVYIATDPDREGEAIAKNLVTTLKIDKKYYRITYHEITDEAIKTAIENKHDIDEDLVNAQKSRRMLDRIIGFKLSQLMKKSVRNTPTNPSAGRVQSIALKLVVDREREIEAFIPTLYSQINAKITDEIIADFFWKNEPDFKGENTWINRDKAQNILEELNKNKTLEVVDFKISHRKEGAITPYKQSVLYKEAKYASSTVQAAAQKLFESGLITYPRTDSTRLSEVFIQKAKKYIEKQYGKEYVADEVKGFAGDQDAHEAIRPTDVKLTPEEAQNKYGLSDIDTYIYKIIYQKTMMAIMKSPQRDIFSYELKNGEYFFRMSYSVITFMGYYAISGYESGKTLPKYNIGDVLDVAEFIKLDKETNPPARYNEGSLIKALDDIKVGRPSTFASTVKIIKDRLFVESQGSALKPTEFGKVVLDKLIENFPTTINEEYTAKVEEELDEIADGKQNYQEIMQEFWDRFIQHYDGVSQNIEVTVLENEKLEEPCPECGSELVYRYAKSNGNKFIGCSNFPNCRYVKSLENKKRFYRRWKK